MSEPTRTTVYLEADVYRRLKALADASGVSAASLIREAVAEYTARRLEKKRPRTIGMFRSGVSDLGSRDEDYLEGFGE